jgi:hypothetical protein
MTSASSRGGQEALQVLSGRDQQHLLSTLCRTAQTMAADLD